MSSRIISNLFWRFAERMGAQLVSFIVSVILARLIDPEVFGTIALMTVFITIVQVFVDSGLGNALIQKKDADDLDFSTVFWANIVLCIVLYWVLYFLSPLIAGFYDAAEITPMLRVLSLLVIISGVKNVQQAYISKKLLFRRFFFATLIGTICAAVVGIYLAFNGAGAWALIIQTLVNAGIDTIMLWLTVKWRPQFKFSFVRLKKLYSYGWKMLISALLETGYNKLRELLIGKVYTSSDLAFYERGQKMPDIFISNVNVSIDSVLLPVMSEKQDKKDKIRELTRCSIQTSVYIIAPLMMGLVFTAEPIIGLLLGEKWLACVPYMRIFCITYMFYPIHTANLNAIKAMGRSDVFLIMEIIKKVIGLTLLLLTLNISVMAMTYVLLISCLTSQIINSWPNRKMLDYSYLNQIKDILPSLLLALFMGIVVFFIGRVPLGAFGLTTAGKIVLLIIQILCGAGIYIVGSKVLKLEPFEMMLGIIRNRRQKNNG